MTQWLGARPTAVQHEPIISRRLRPEFSPSRANPLPEPIAIDLKYGRVLRCLEDRSLRGGGTDGEPCAARLHTGKAPATTARFRVGVPAPNPLLHPAAAKASWREVSRAFSIRERRAGCRPRCRRGSRRELSSTPAGPRRDHRGRRLPPGTDGVHVLRLQVGVRSTTPPRAEAALQARRPPRETGPRLARRTLSFRPVDDEARRRARTDHETSLVLEAGRNRKDRFSWTGSSRCSHGPRDTRQSAAVTSPRSRATMKLGCASAWGRAGRFEPHGGRRDRAVGALDILERASDSTIHACARRCSMSGPECGVVPGSGWREAETDRLFGEAGRSGFATRLVEGDDIVLTAGRCPSPRSRDWPSFLAARPRAPTRGRTDLEPLVAGLRKRGLRQSYGSSRTGEPPRGEGQA